MTIHIPRAHVGRDPRYHNRMASYLQRHAEHKTLREQDLTHDPRAGDYTEVADDKDWLVRDERGDWGGDDSHNDMLGFCPTDARLIEWRCGPGRGRWLARVEEYTDPDRDPCPEYAKEIARRVKELDERFNTFGRQSEAG